MACRFCTMRGASTSYWRSLLLLMLNCSIISSTTRLRKINSSDLHSHGNLQAPRKEKQEKPGAARRWLEKYGYDEKDLETPVSSNSTTQDAKTSITSDSTKHSKTSVTSDRNGDSTRSSTKSNSTASWMTQPKVYFLFLAIDKISNLNVWNSFFENAPWHKYQALVHCKVPQSCEQNLDGTVFKLVPTVESSYCTDLVSPMNRLLYHALQDAADGDKFVFISDSTLPAKPFAEVYRKVTGRDGSAFCIFPSAEWADRPEQQHREIAAKHHQWIILDYDHAVKSEDAWRRGYYGNFMRDYQMNYKYYTRYNNSFADHRNFGCLDEFWHMLALYGPFQASWGAQEHWQNLPDFQGSTVYVGKAGWQGTCDTFVMWWKYLHETSSGYNPFLSFYNALDGESRPHGGNNARPGWWDTISRYGIQVIRNSDFLFVRKFIDNPMLAGGGDFHQAYTSTVLR
eukprot:gnl/TRDRNA2_/TRDRNA2_42079_c0_seq1.p1 gnl/TRDRNA2_/TRDRNA2_42079_c0~~gnl/TRDRNA2_/TRDRNA2_42079_c0_seq1.p1  ORF type:complete len:455 (-),score=50.06 gnl/TRDRNA2_/TRDRNA2_42079_c0_seq1:147-1511(-)